MAKLGQVRRKDLWKQFRDWAWVNVMLGADSKGVTVVMNNEQTSSSGNLNILSKPASKPVPVITDAVSLQERLIIGHMALVRRLAAKFRYSGEPLEDLVQVGNLGLVKAAQKFDEDRGTPFAAFAVPVIVGEIKNYFRDHGWSVKLPRKLQTNKRTVDQAADVLIQNLGRSPTVMEIAESTGLSVEEVNQTFELDGFGKPASLDLEYQQGDGGDSATLMDFLGSVDPAMENLAEVLDLTASIDCLSHQEKRIMYLRYHSGLSQSETAALMKVSQMQVSRLQRGALSKLKAALLEVPVAY